jgi:hypothetical protein
MHTKEKETAMLLLLASGHDYMHSRHDVSDIDHGLHNRLGLGFPRKQNKNFPNRE